MTTSTLYLVGLGLGDEKDITVKGLEAVRRSSKVFLEHYTAILGVDKDRLEAFYEKKIDLADRELVESGCDAILDAATDGKAVSLLVVGDPFCATTHSDLLLRAQSLGIRVEVIHNASIMSAIGACGLQMYNFGATVSICFFRDSWKPTSFYDKVKYNMAGELHTLALLDIKVKEPNLEAMSRGKIIYEKPRYMSVNVAVEQLIEVEEEIRKEGVYSRDTMAVGVARIGQPDQRIVAGTLEELRTVDFGAPLHSLVIVAKTHPLEDEMLAHFRVNDATPRLQAPADGEGEDDGDDDDEVVLANEGAGGGVLGNAAAASDAEAPEEEVAKMAVVAAAEEEKKRPEPSSHAQDEAPAAGASTGEKKPPAKFQPLFGDCPTDSEDED